MITTGSVRGWCWAPQLGQLRTMPPPAIAGRGPPYGLASTANTGPSASRPRSSGSGACSAASGTSASRSSSVTWMPSSPARTARAAGSAGWAASQASSPRCSATRSSDPPVNVRLIRDDLLAMAWTVADMPSQNGRIAVVTGATSGLGYHTARALAGAGAEVVVAVRDAERGERVRQEVGAAAVVRLDLAEQASVRAAAEALLARWPRIDLLVN